MIIAFINERWNFNNILVHGKIEVRFRGIIFIKIVLKFD